MALDFGKDFKCRYCLKAKFPIIMATEIQKPMTMNLAPVLNLKSKCKLTKLMVNKNGINAGLYCNDSKNSPFNKAINALCIPQLGHSIPKYFTKKQVDR